MISISGIRGRVGESLTPDQVVKYSAAFAELCERGPIVIGRDGRGSGKVIGNLAVSTLLSMGCDVIALGVVPTPTIQLAVEHLGTAGGISITASHNPVEWNGLKFIGRLGLVLDAAGNHQLCSIADAGVSSYVPWNKLGRHTHDESFLQKHADLVLRLPMVKMGEIRKRRFKIVLDCVNGAGGVIIPQLLQRMGCVVVEMNCDVSGAFAHPPEPIPENLTSLCTRVCEEKADLGVAVDPDGDRLVLITERGEPYGEENTIASVVKFVLAHNRKNNSSQNPRVVVNLSTTRAVDDIAREEGAEVIRTPVGEINVAQAMKKYSAIVGGEGSGGVILPALHHGRDAIVGICLVLQQLTEFGGTLSQLKSSLPQYSIVKSKISISDGNIDRLWRKLSTDHSGNGSVNTDDGLKLDFPDSWIHLRKSNTEPIVRIIAEAATRGEAEKLIEKFKSHISQTIT